MAEDRLASAQTMKLSLAGWSLNERFMQKRNALRLLDFPKVARSRFGIDAIEPNNIFFESTTLKYLRELKKCARNEGVSILNIAVDEPFDMCQGGWLGRRAVNGYAWWIPIAAELGCTAIRANSGGGDARSYSSAQFQACADNFANLADRARPLGIRIVMENHWGLSGDPDRMLKVRKMSSNAFDFLVDFGNWPKTLDRYAALEKIMPYAHAVHAKIYQIDANGRHPSFNLGRCVQIAKSAGYDGFLGIEYEGGGNQDEGVRRAMRELKKFI